MKSALAPLLTLLVVAACATPEERCVGQATKDLRIVNALIAETEANLSRGYAIETYDTERFVMRLCSRSDGTSEICWIPQVRSASRPVAIDLGAERAKLGSLIAKRAELEVTARRGIAACRTATER